MFATIKNKNLCRSFLASLVIVVLFTEVVQCRRLRKCGRFVNTRHQQLRAQTSTNDEISEIKGMKLRHSVNEEKQCGAAPLLTTGGKIVGGRPAKVGEFPWQVAVLKNGLRGLQVECGGAILDKYWIISAAHCFEEVQLDDVKVAIGIHNTKEIEKMNLLSVEKIKIHENLRSGKGDVPINDIALLRLSSPIDLQASDLINSVCLPKQGEEFTKMVQVSGWGRTDERGIYSDELRSVEVTLKNDSDCKASLDGFYHQNEMICAGFKKGGKDACEGDSGSPLVKRKVRAILVGLVSYGIGCARKGKPGIYTRVSNYVDWISKNTQQ